MKISQNQLFFLKNCRKKIDIIGLSVRLMALNSAEKYRGDWMEPRIARPEKILTFSEAVEKIRLVKMGGQKVVLAQGAFDILHIGHIHYLRLAKRGGDILFVATEKDETLRLNKGEKRPFNNVDDRLNFLSELEAVDYTFAYGEVINYNRSNEIFARRLNALAPTLLAVSVWDHNFSNKKTLAERAGIEILSIEDLWVNSTSRLLKFIGYE